MWTVLLMVSIEKWLRPLSFLDYGRKISAVVLNVRFLACVLDEFLPTTLTGAVTSELAGDDQKRG